MTSSSHASELYFACSKKSALYFVGFLLLYEISSYIANDMIMPGMIQVVHSFSAPDSMVSTSLTAFIWGGGSLQIFLGPLSDRYGRRLVLLSGVTLFLICTLFLAMAQTMSQFILGRFFQGMGLCFISVIGYATLQEIFVENYAVRTISIMNSITILAPLSGPLLGAIFLHYFPWQVIFYFIALLASIALVGIWQFMPETVGQMRIDGSINAHTSLHLDVVKNNYLALIKNLRFLLGSLAIGFLNIPIIAWIGTSPLILIKQAHLSVLEYGMWQIPVFIFSIVGNVVVRRHLKHTPLTRISELGAIWVLSSLLFMALITYLFKQSYLSVIAGVTLYSFGLGYLSAPLNRLVLFSTMVPKGTSAALISLILMFTIGAGNEIAGIIYAAGNNGFFSLYCALAGIIFYALFYGMAYPWRSNVQQVN